MDFTAVLAQIKPKLGCVADNLTTIEEQIVKAREAGADLIVFPELALSGYFLKDLVPEAARRIDSPEIRRLIELSRSISIAIGFVEETDDYHFFNSALYLEDGAIRHLHRKVYLPTYGLFDEQRYLARGESFRAFDTKFGRFGMLICEDMWHLSASYILAMDGATTLICLSSSPARGIEGENRVLSDPDDRAILILQLRAGSGLGEKEVIGANNIRDRSGAPGCGVGIDGTVAHRVFDLGHRRLGERLCGVGIKGWE